MILARAMFKHARSLREAHARQGVAALERQIKALDRDIEKTLPRIVDTTSRTVIQAFERNVEALEHEKAILTEQATHDA